MIGQVEPVPVLRVSSREIDDPGPLEALLEAGRPLVLVRNGNGAAGFGEALRLEFSGPNRFAEASLAWQRVVAASIVEESVDVAGSGLVAAGSFTFSADSADASRLIVPSVVIGRRGGRAWVTTIDGGTPPAPTPLGAPFSVRFDDGRPDEFTAAVRAAIDRIRAGELEKAVIARTIAGTVPAGADLRRIVSALARNYPDALTFAVDGLLGASPETLVRVEGKRVTARVLAGTTSRGTTNARDELSASTMLASAKESIEHDLARQSVLDGLAAHCTGLTSGDPFVLQLPNLMHIASDIEGTLSDSSSSLDLVAALHPTAAVAGTPTDVALRVISELEPFDRRRYAGPVGWVGADGDGEWAVALRCAEISPDGSVTAFAGAGIVADSDPERELAETGLKFLPVVESFR